jgi:hypothetical protein
MLLDAHVTHLHFGDELVDRHPLGALERVKNFQPLGAANFCEQSLIHGLRKWDCPTLDVSIFKKQD